MPHTPPDWWKNAVIYQIYPRSFADTDGDGVGNIAGITSRVPYLSRLGVDAVWLSPFYPSALADGGYDVDDYRDVDPRLGTLQDFDAMVEALHGAGIKVVVDIVPNHSSDRHAWFRAALAAGRDSRERRRYIFRDGLGPAGELPPNDWESLFGGSAWEPVGDGQWYFHLFAREQPDLNWDDEEVRDDFLRTLRFWSDRGVDGFRVDVAHGLVKDMSEPFAPWTEVAVTGRTDGSHPLWDRDAVHEVYAQWRRVFDEYDPPRFAVAEAGVHPSRRARYASADGLGQAFNFEMQEAGWWSADFRKAIDSGLEQTYEHGSTTTWLLGCHDAPRVATRYGLPEDPELTTMNAARQWLLTDGTTPTLDRALGERRARAAALVTLALPGSTYIYQGEELGLHEVGDLPPEVLEDPIATRSGGREKGRDGCRVPLPWAADGPSFGFGPGPARPPQPSWFESYAVSVQAEDPDSTLTLYRRAMQLRTALNTGADFEWIESGPADVLQFRRSGGWLCLANFGTESVALPAGEVLLSSAPLEAGRLPQDATAWLRVAP
ncbi:glycoside hydrolase family 13 protein [Streptomyces regalis]|uniref:Alpha-amylase n=1 Tax=Streptomyces regalis TaxID=68262 RepID=A0A101J6V2_9ACTN|nr:glycoside hydrolase family 13 protein [Streptomyces regalis]KUL21317.1 alpha-amylase [Streptomyces regalis]